MSAVRRRITQSLVVRDSAGSVSVEAAMGLLAILFAVLVAAWCAGMLMAQLAVGEAARAAVRVAARGDSGSLVIAEARRLVPEAEVDMQHDGGDIRVQVSRIVYPPGALHRLGSIRLTASSVAADEAQP